MLCQQRGLYNSFTLLFFQCSHTHFLTLKRSRRPGTLISATRKETCSSRQCTSGARSAHRYTRRTRLFKYIVGSGVWDWKKKSNWVCLATTHKEKNPLLPQTFNLLVLGTGDTSLSTLPNLDPKLWVPWVRTRTQFPQQYPWEKEEFTIGCRILTRLYTTPYCV